MEIKRAYFTHNISGYVDVPPDFTSDDITHAIQKSIKIIGMKINNRDTFLHKIHLPKRKVTI